MPLFLSDSISLLAATAAPPMRSDVLINSTLIFVECLDKSTAFAAFCSINLLFF